MQLIVYRHCVGARRHAVPFDRAAEAMNLRDGAGHPAQPEPVRHPSGLLLVRQADAVG